MIWLDKIFLFVIGYNILLGIILNIDISIESYLRERK